MHEGLDASEQVTRPCPCGVGRLARWPWALHTDSLGFCPALPWSTEDRDTDDAVAEVRGKHCVEMFCWRSEWIEAAPGGDRIPW